MKYFKPNITSEDVVGIIKIYPGSEIIGRYTGNRIRVYIPHETANRLFKVDRVFFDQIKLIIREATTLDNRNVYKLQAIKGGMAFNAVATNDEEIIGTYEIEYSENKDGFNLYKSEQCN